MARLGRGFPARRHPPRLANTKFGLPKIETLVDTFTSTSAQWSGFGGYTENIVAGQLDIVPSALYPGVVSSSAYDFTSSYLYAQLVQPPSYGTGTITTELAVTLSNSNDNNSIQTVWFENTLVFREKVSGTASDTSIAYDPVAHAVLRIRESGGTVYWDTSPDGVTWNNQRSKTSTLTLTSVYALIISGFYGTEPTPGTAIWESLNTTPVNVPVTPIGAGFFGAYA